MISRGPFNSVHFFIGTILTPVLIMVVNDILTNIFSISGGILLLYIITCYITYSFLNINYIKKPFSHLAYQSITFLIYFISPFVWCYLYFKKS